MTTRDKTTTASTSDAIALLTADHAEVKKCFDQYEDLVDEQASAARRRALATEICTMLTVHAAIEEELFYPAARQVLGEDVDLVDEADVEHESAKALIAQIEAGEPKDDHYDARVRVLGEYIAHHVKEEQNELFPKAKKAGLDTRELGAALAARKEALMSTKKTGASAKA
jgi:hemerythrin superfamily protein